MFGNSEKKKRNKELRKRAGHLSERAACGLHCIKMEDIGVYAGKTPIIEHVNVHIHCGKLTAIIGRNGAGKSTLIKAILGEVAHEGTIEFRDMKENNPTLEELTTWYKMSGLPLKKFFNTSGLLYKSMGLKDKLPAMSEDEQLKLLATDGMLVKRPLVIGEGFVLVGFKESEWSEVVSSTQKSSY